MEIEISHHISIFLVLEKANHDDDDEPKNSGVDSTHTLYAVYGPKCFLHIAPSTEQEKMRNPQKYLKFPICRAPTGKPLPDPVVPEAVLAARRRAFLTRGRVGKKYDDVVSKATEMIEKKRLTYRTLKDVPVASVKVRCKPSFAVDITYQDGTHSLRDKISPQTALRTLGRFMTDRQRQLVMRQQQMADK
ncbi:hypothetical protein EBZ80_13240 [bacterium]|nr:hypothetical protein [bacterium]